MVYKTDTFYFETFKNVFDFEKVIGERPTTEGWENHSETNSKSFTGTESWEEAENLMKYGYEVAEKKLKMDCSKFNTPRARVKTVASVAGFAPIVPNAIMGVPKTMFMNKRVLQKARTVRIILDNTECCGVSSESLLESGSVMLNIVALFERAGVRCNVDLIPFIAKRVPYNKRLKDKLKLMQQLQKCNELRMLNPLHMDKLIQ